MAPGRSVGRFRPEDAPVRPSTEARRLGNPASSRGICTSLPPRIRQGAGFMVYLLWARKARKERRKTLPTAAYFGIQAFQRSRSKGLDTQTNPWAETETNPWLPAPRQQVRHRTLGTAHPIEGLWTKRAWGVWEKPGANRIARSRGTMAEYLPPVVCWAEKDLRPVWTSYWSFRSEDLRQPGELPRRRVPWLCAPTLRSVCLFGFFGR